MSKRKEHHVVPNPQGGWSIKKGGGKKAIKNTNLKSTAVGIARKISRNQGTELIIHNKKDRIHKSDSHGEDPHPPKG